MKFRGTLWLILIFVALGLYLALYEVPSEKKKDDEAIRSQYVLHFKVEDVQEFELIRKDTTLKIKRNPADSRWNLVAPQAVPGDDSVINQFLVSLEEATVTRVVDEAPKALGDFGLEDPPLKIVLRFKTGDPQTLLVGRSSPMGHNTYLKTGDDPRVLISFIDKGQLNASLNDLRSKLLLSYVPRDITAVELAYDGKRQSFHQKGGEWKLTAPVEALGDGDEISNFLNAVRRERIEAFIADTPEEAKALGLDPARIEVTLQAEKAGQSWTLKIGKAYDDHSFYARRASTENIFTVSESLVETLSRNPLSFMEKSLFTLEEDAVTEIESRRGDEVVHMIRDPEKTGGWKFKEDHPEGVDSATVNTLLLDLKEARIQEFAPVHDFKLFGLDTPRQTLTVHQQERDPITLSLGNADPDGKHFFATRSTDPSVFKLDAESVKKIFRADIDYKDKTLLKFTPEQVALIRIQTSNQTFQLKRQDNQWTLVQPEPVEDLKPFIGKDILWTLNNLEYAVKLAEPQTAEISGMEHPRLIISLEGTDHQSLGEIRIGHSLKEEPLVFGQVTGSPSLYHIKDRILSEIPTTLEQFRKKDN